LLLHDKHIDALTKGIIYIRNTRIYPVMFTGVFVAANICSICLWLLCYSVFCFCVYFSKIFCHVL